MIRHREGLSVFVDHRFRWTSEAERRFRIRPSAADSKGGADFTAIMYGTLAMNGIDVRRWLHES